MGTAVIDNPPTAAGLSMSKSDLSLLNAAAGEITQEALFRNVSKDMEAQQAVEDQQQAEFAASMEKKVNLEDEGDDFDDYEDDPMLLSIQEKRLAEMKARYAKEKAFHMQGHGEYREIVEEEFLKEVCGSEDVLVHFYHREFQRCKIIDKHLRILAPKHRNCKMLYLNAEKAPFFVAKLAVQMLPSVVVFKDGIAADRITGFEELGGKDEFRTEVLEHKFSKSTVRALERPSNSDSESDGDN